MASVAPEASKPGLVPLHEGLCSGHSRHLDLQLKLNILSNVGVGGWCPVSPGPCHGQQRCPGPGCLGPAPLPLPVVGALTLRCRPHPGVPAALASLLEQTTNTGRVYVLSQRSSQSPGFTAWPAGPWAQPGCDYAEPRGRLHRCPGTPKLLLLSFSLIL